MIFMTIYSLLAIAFFMYNLRCHMKAKGFFWAELPVSKKKSSIISATKKFCLQKIYLSQRNFVTF